MLVAGQNYQVHNFKAIAPMPALIELKIETRTQGDLGAYRALLTAGDASLTLTGTDYMTSANRLPLTAALAALSVLKRRSLVEIYTNSAYLAHGACSLIPAWYTEKGNAPAFRSSIRNEQLWDSLIEVASRHDVQWHWAAPVVAKASNHADITTSCKRCGGEVVWIREDGKHVAVDLAGSLHALTCRQIAAQRGATRFEIWGRTPGYGGSAVYAGSIAPWLDAFGVFRDFTPTEKADPTTCDHITDDDAVIDFDDDDTAFTPSITPPTSSAHDHASILEAA